MIELELYKFVTDEDNNIEYHRTYRNKESRTKDQVVLLINFSDLQDFNKLLGEDYLSECWIDCEFLNDCIWFEMSDICENFDIILENVFINKD